MSQNQLFTAAINGDLIELQSQINNGIDVNLKDSNGKTALMHAVYKENLAVVKLLLENNADPNIKDRDGDTALDYAKIFNYTNIVQLLENVTLETLKKDTNSQILEENPTFYTNPINNNSFSKFHSSTDKRDLRNYVFIGCFVLAAILIGLVAIRKPSSSISSSDNQTDSLQSKNFTDRKLTKPKIEDLTDKPTSSIPKPSVSNKIAKSQTSPKQAVIDQYSLINNGQYQDAWNRLSSQLRNDRVIFPSGYNSYKNWWTTVKQIKVTNTQAIRIDEKEAIIRVDLSYYMQNGKVFSESRDIHLSWNTKIENWLVVKANKIN